MDEFNQIEQMASQLTEETRRIIENNFPLDSREFLESENKSKVETNDAKIVELAKMYLELYRQLPIEEKVKRNFLNIQGTYYQQTHQIKGLNKAYSHSDEYELHDAFSKATKFGMEAIESLELAAKTNDEQLAIKSQSILKHCYDILNVHYWGKSRIDYLERYKVRLKNGRKIEEDLKEYEQLKEQARILSIDYAKAILNGITEAEKEQFNLKFEEIFTKEKFLTEFIPSDILKGVYVNLHWLKVDAERTPNNVLEAEIHHSSQM